MGWPSKIALGALLFSTFAIVAACSAATGVQSGQEDGSATQQQVKELQAELDSVEDDLELAEKNLDIANKNLERRDDRIKELKGELANVEERNEQLKQENESLETQIAEFEAQVNEDTPEGANTKQVTIEIYSDVPVDVSIMDDYFDVGVSEEIVGSKTYEFEIAADSGLIVSAMSESMMRGNISIAVYENGEFVAEDTSSEGYAQVMY